MGVLRLGYVHARVTDMAEAKDHYANTLGMYPVDVENGDGKAYFKGWDEWEHHSIVLEEGGVGLVKLGYRVEKAEDLDVIEKKAGAFGCSIERMAKGDNVEVSDGLRITTPSEHVIELYHDMTVVGTMVGDINPEVFPRHLVGVGVPNIDHALITAEDPGLMERFFDEVLDFYPTERVQTSLDDDHELVGTWMSCGQKIHDIAVIGGPQGKLHHFAFELADWSQIGRAGAIFSMDDVSVDIGPTQHGITRGHTIYFFDPSGNRNEVFAGGYRAYPDRPVVRWTVDQLGKGIFYVDRELNERFTTVLT
ncbi:MAG: catechol 2,3-dioxygenase [Mobilicoccus sp.]|nr:catechol 2,3-dioxygenase [Mobilicoccus sp.]